MEIEEDVEAQQQEQEPSKKLQRVTDDSGMRNWSNPSSRIIRVSRATGGKDRHSKVLTSKGLRDRRIRLSVSTAIQFYDLQDRLGVDQPSKAVDWLINAAADSISELPSLNTNFDQAISAGSSGTSESSLLSLSKNESRRGKARERARERTAKDLQNEQSSFTQLLTRGFDQPNPAGSGSDRTNQHRNWTAGSDCFNPVQLIPLPQFSNNHYSSVPNYNFGISSSDSPAGINGGHTNRGTLQSNSQSLFLSNNMNQRSSSSPMDSQSISFFTATTPPLDPHHFPATFDGRLHLYYGEGNRSSTGVPTITKREGDT